jgi:hypothetical protein
MYDEIGRLHGVYRE